MALRFWFGASGSGKTRRIQEEMIRRAGEDRQRVFLMIVPDQFTMHTQKQLVTMHPDGGILNLDVLSFSRLAHRIFEEVGREDRLTLDDTGKCLILRRVVTELKEEIPVLSAGLKNPGYLQQLKSVISEFMQYAFTPEDVKGLAEFSLQKRSLSLKLEEISRVYAAFLEACKKRYITTEETMDLLCERIPYSGLIKRSVIVFDGFTGFTPIQNRVIEQLLLHSKEVNVTLENDHRYSPYTRGEKDFLFALTRKTTESLQKLAMANNIPMGDDVILDEIPVKRYASCPELAHLERNLFRDKREAYEGVPESIRMVRAGNVRQECSLVCREIFTLIEEKGYRYRDIAIVSADMSCYEDALRQQFEKYGVPYFMDNTRSLPDNPFVALIRNTLNVLRSNFAYDEVMAFLRSGLTSFTLEEVDRLENYIRARGIRGYSAWSKEFRYPGKELVGKPEALEALNEMRSRLAVLFAPLQELNKAQGASAREWCTTLYDFMVKENLQYKLQAYADAFKEMNNPAKAKEYEQVYRLIMDLLDQIVKILGEEKLTLKEISEILDAGLAELRVASLPQSVDILMVGDIERTRLKDVKAVFFLGVNEGKIPRENNAGGLISDLDRTFLTEYGKELAPTPEERMYIQQLYLYMNLTKPMEYLWLSFASVAEDGTGLRPAYLIGLLQEIFPEGKVEFMANENPILSVEDGKTRFAELIQGFYGFALSEEEEELFLTLYRDLKARPECAQWLDGIIKTANRTYIPEKLDKTLVEEIYGTILDCSISSLEKYAGCQYAHFLSYGLGLSAGEEYGFEALDMGNVSHELLQNFGESLLKDGINWGDVEDKAAESLLESLLDKTVTSYSGGILTEDAQKVFFTRQLKRIINRTVRTLRNHLNHGTFVPYAYEQKFRKLYEETMPSGELLRILLKGKIDRIDLCRKDDECLVKVIDYKTGSKSFDLTNFYYGLSLQLAIYMQQAMEWMKQENPESNPVPAAMLYYKIQDPILSEKKVYTEAEWKYEFEKMFCCTGIVNERSDIIDRLDANLSGNSVVIPVLRNKDGTLRASGNHVSQEELETILEYGKKKAFSLAGEIKEGNIKIRPVAGNCEYCDFKGACGYDARIKGYEEQELPKVTMEEFLKSMGKEETGDHNKEEQEG